MSNNVKNLHSSNFPRLRRAALDSLRASAERATTDAQRALFDAHISPLAQSDVRSFLLPENGAIIDEGTRSKLSLDSCRLPFTHCALEYSITPKHYRTAAPNNWRPSATVLIVEQGEDGGAISARCVWREDTDGQSRWYPAALGFCITLDSTIEVLDRQTVLLDKLSITYVHEAYKPTQSRITEAVQDFAHEAAVLAHFALLCSCDNVSPTKIFEPDPKLVKRSKQRGNLPPDEYYVLDCFLGEHRERGPSGDGEHASPRFHVRRGHIRRLQSGALTWIKQTTVGDINNGAIDKDYRVRVRRSETAEKKN